MIFEIYQQPGIEMAVLKELILEQLCVVKKSVDNLKNQQQAPKNSTLFEGGDILPKSRKQQ